jgi:hypothetical protein
MPLSGRVHLPGRWISIGPITLQMASANVGLGGCVSGMSVGSWAKSLHVLAGGQGRVEVDRERIATGFNWAVRLD